MSALAVELRSVTLRFVGPGGAAVVAVDQVSLSIGQGEFFTLLGPSGCGKTSTLRMIAGFEVPTSGEVLIAGRLMTQVPPYGRPVNMVFQNYALFPHLNVAQNVAFGLKVARVPLREREQRVTAMLELLRLPDIRARRVWELSGGQQQRVALARALINRPAVLLLDEPLGALDLKLRKELQSELKRIQHEIGVTFVYVTHDQEEALTMSDRIAVMQGGRVQQIGDPRTIYEQPANRFVADFIGESTFLAGRVLALDAQALAVAGSKQELTPNRTVLLDVAGVAVAAMGRCADLAVGQAVTLAVRPEKVVVQPMSLAQGAALPGTICEAVYLGTDMRYVVRLDLGGYVTARVQNATGRGFGEFALGQAVAVSWAVEDGCVLVA